MGKKYVRIPELESERQLKSKTIAIMNNKGGCGKTTTAMALGMYLARTGNNILFWDNDPQSNLTQRLGLSDDEKKEDRIDILFRSPEKDTDMSLVAEYPYLQRISGTKEGVGKVGIMPGSHYSESYADGLDKQFRSFGREFQERVNYTSIYHLFRSRIDYYRKYYDYIIIDTAPALEGNILNTLAVRTANELICPIDGLEAALGVRQLLNWMDVQTTALDTRPNALFTMVKYQLDTKNIGDFSTDKQSRNSVFRILKEVYGDFVCDNGVRELRSLRHSTKGVPGFGGKTEYTVLCDEIMTRLNSASRVNIFEFAQRNGAVRDLEIKLATIAKKVRKRKPKFKQPKYSTIETPLTVPEVVTDET